MSIMTPKVVPIHFSIRLMMFKGEVYICVWECLYYCCFAQSLPKFVFWDRSCYRNTFMANRMFYGQVARMKGDAPVGIASWGAIFQITFYGASHLGQLASYLVVPSSVETDLQEVISVAGGYELIVKYSFFGTRHLSFIGSCRIGLLLAGEPVCEGSFRFFGAILYYGPIGLAHFVVFGKHLVQARQGLACLGKQYNARNRSVQPVHYAQIYVAGLVVLVLEPVLDNIREGSVAGLVALHNLPRLFVHYYKMVVFV